MRFDRLLFPLLLAACSKGDADGSGAAAAKAELPATALLSVEPTGALDVKTVIASAKSGDHVVVHGRVGDAGATTAFFTLVDPSLKACNEGAAMDECPTPWDFCCTPVDEMPKVFANVQFRQGENLRAGSLLGVGGLDHLTPVTVAGTAQKDEQGNLTIVADALFVKR